MPGSGPVPGTVLPQRRRRCVGSERLADSALRVRATAMAAGQTAGALAALSADRGSDVVGVPMAGLRQVLVRSGAIVPPLPASAGSDPGGGGRPRGGRDAPRPSCPGGTPGPSPTAAVVRTTPCRRTTTMTPLFTKD
ncbi:FAD-dependent oxidoreductase [Streptomyces sp. NPDC088249]|uniref:FAD-dependent oxidoreductase n=1 Tax=Streptomyces sp. NPDC088249 TaxID=3365843 RepID=UPI003830A488